MLARLDQSNKLAKVVVQNSLVDWSQHQVLGRRNGCRVCHFESLGNDPGRRQRQSKKGGWCCDVSRQWADATKEKGNGL